LLLGIDCQAGAPFSRRARQGRADKGVQNPPGEWYFEQKAG